VAFTFSIRAIGPDGPPSQCQSSLKITYPDTFLAFDSHILLKDGSWMEFFSQFFYKSVKEASILRSNLFKVDNNTFIVVAIQKGIDIGFTRFFRNNKSKSGVSSNSILFLIPSYQILF
jgi:predicted nucleic-acid-binding Zn-ribbon protein